MVFYLVYLKLSTIIMLSLELKKNIQIYFYDKIRSLGCVVYELLFLQIAFPNGCIDNNTKRPDFGNSMLFSALLEK